MLSRVQRGARQLSWRDVASQLQEGLGGLELWVVVLGGTFGT